MTKICFWPATDSTFKLPSLLHDGRTIKALKSKISLREAHNVMEQNMLIEVRKHVKANSFMICGMNAYSGYEVRIHTHTYIHMY